MTKNTLPLFLCFFLLAVTINVDSQIIFSKNTSPTKYLAATSEPDTNWFNPGFDDSSWSQDTGAIGFGYSLIKRPVNTSAKSVYVRCYFQITDKSIVKAMNLKVDFDDGYIAYLNGHEVARVNVDTTKQYPAFDDLAIRSRQSVLDKKHYMAVVPGIYLDSAVLALCLVNGSNVMALHALNDSTNGTDLCIETEIVNLTGYPYPYIYYDIYSRYKRLVSVDSSNLPLVIINTDQFGIPYNKNYRTKAFMGIIDNGTGYLNKPGDVCNIYNGPVSLELRGQSSRDFTKQSYRLELIDSLGNDTSVSLLGMPKDNDWILFGPYADKSQVRNKLEYDLGRKLGEYEPRTRYCEVILNGQLVGFYYLTENIKREKHRVNIKKLDATNISGTDVTGGYIFKWDKESDSRQIVYPKDDEIRPQQIAYVAKFFHISDSALASNGFDDPINGFRKYFSDSSLVDYIIMNEIPKNADSYLYSTYFYKDREDTDNRIKYGPLWDYDLGFGNTTFQDGYKTNGWQFAYRQNQRLKITRFLQDTLMVDLLQSRWHDLRNGILSNDSIFSMMDTLINSGKIQIDRNYQVWPIIDKVLFYPAYSVSTYDQEISAFKSWLTTRLAWIDANINNIYFKKVVTNIEIAYSTAGVFDLNVFPNPFKNRFSLALQIEKQCDARIEIVNLTSQIEYAKNLKVHTGFNEINIDDSRIDNMGSGIYLLRFFINNIPVSTLKIIKN